MIQKNTYAVTDFGSPFHSFNNEDSDLNFLLAFTLN